MEVALNAAMADWTHRYAMALGALLVGAGFGALIFVNSVSAAGATVVIWTFGEMILLPASSAFVSDTAPSQQASAYMGLYTMGFSVAVAIGPWLGTRYSLVHSSYLFLYLSLISSLIPLLASSVGGASSLGLSVRSELSTERTNS